MRFKQLLQAIYTNAPKHVCVYGYHELLKVGKKEVVDLILLVQNIREFVGYCATLEGWLRTEHPGFYLLEADDLQIQLSLHEKGKGLFPEKHESELLRSKIITQNLIYIPGEQTEFWTLMYLKYVLNIENDKFNEVFRTKVTERVGFTNKIDKDKICFSGSIKKQLKEKQQLQENLT